MWREIREDVFIYTPQNLSEEWKSGIHHIVMHIDSNVDLSPPSLGIQNPSK